VVVAHSADGRLPRVRAEGEAVAALFGGDRLFDEDATVESVRDRVRDADLLHIAAHGLSRSDAPNFSHIGLADGQLTAFDCLDLELDCELVALSACETGRAVVAPGDEQIGLTRSFLYAGARSVLQSLWRVEDEATSRLMVGFYQRLRRGRGRAAALRAAQLDMLASAAHRHPVFWAAFGLVGDWSRLSGRRARARPPSTGPTPSG
jgi:CHAT domain-containing protein